ncbi:MAG: inositol 2-dehydrogenase [Candidatus Nanopelagicales bacterium]
MSDLRIGVIGTGRIGRMHADYIARQTPRATLSAVSDVSEASAAEVAEMYGVPAMSADEVIAASDAVAICSSTDTHVDYIIAAADAGKAIFCEKPVSLDLAEVDRAAEVLERTGVPFMVGFNRRFDPGHRAVRDAVLSGRIGDVRMARVTSRDPSPPPVEYVRVSGGIWVDMMIHDFDMAAFVIGSPVVAVWAQGANLIDPAIGEAGDVDVGIAVLTHANGAITTIDVSREAPYGYDQRVEVLGSLGMAVSDNERLNRTEVYLADETRKPVLPNFFIERYETAYRDQWRYFTDYVLDGGASPVSLADGRAPVVIAAAAAESARTGMPITI